MTRFEQMAALAEAGKLNTEIGEIVGLKRARVAQIFKEAGRLDLCGYSRRSADGASNTGPKGRSVRVLPTQAEVRAALSYDPETGVFRWKHREDRHARWNSRFVGKVAGALNVKHGYWEIRLNDVLYYGHHIAWVYQRGALPEGKRIDHRDRNRGNNKWENLRLSTCSQNMANRIANRGRSLPKGVYSRGHRFYAVLCREQLGTFDTPEAASAAYMTAAKARFGEFARQ